MLLGSMEPHSKMDNRNKDDLHEWSIYRQNLNSIFAEKLVSPKEVPLPYGNFRMRESVVRTLTREGNRERTRERENTDNYVVYGLPRVKSSGVPEYSTLHHRLLNSRQKEEKEKMKRKTRSDWDLSGRSDDVITQSITLSTAPQTVETHYAESEVQPNNGNFFGSMRHHSHYFSNIDLFRPTGFNYLKYAKASEMTQGENNGNPHLCINHLAFAHDLRTNFERAMLGTKRHLNTLSDITFELNGGNTMGLMYTNELEMRTFLRLLSGEAAPAGKLKGEFMINGHQLKPEQLASRIAHVPIEDPPDVLTVNQYLKYSSSIRPPATSAFRVENMIDQLVQTLALGPFSNQLIRDIGHTEKQRLKIAAQVLKDTDVLICDNITRDMDIYDVAFIIDYLRDWAIKLKRIVIVAIAPTTVEILTMFHKAAIMASGRIVYMGGSEDMVPYFEKNNFPCPMFKNPCDYYVDLVTHDHLTSESSQESLQRIRHLAETWRRIRPSPKPITLHTVSPRVAAPGVASKLWTVYKRFWCVFFNNPLQYLFEPLVVAILSLLIGVIFIDLQIDKRSGINDRFGLICVWLGYAMMPIGMINIANVGDERNFVHRDISLNYYSAQIHVLSKLLFDVPFFLLTLASYVLPVLFLSGMQASTHLHLPSLLIFILSSGIHLSLWRYIAWTSAYVAKQKLGATAIFSSLFLFSFLSSGLLITSNDQGKSIQMLRTISPTYYIAQILLEEEFTGYTSLQKTMGVNRSPNVTELLFDCEKKSVLATKIKEIPIFTVSQCSKLRGRHILAAAGFPPFDLHNTALLQLRTAAEQKTAQETPTISRELLMAGIVYIGWFCSAFIFMFLTATFNHRPLYKGGEYEM